jgi:hypothetical protein
MRFIGVRNETPEPLVPKKASVTALPPACRPTVELTSEMAIAAVMASSVMKEILLYLERSSLF